MLPSTLTAIRAIISADQSIDLSARNRILATISNPVSTNTDPNSGVRLIRRAEAAKILGRSIRAVDLLRSQGVLHQVTFPGRARGAGFRLSDVQALITGKVA